MEFHRLHAVGDDFDVDAFLERHPLGPDCLWHAGDLRPTFCVESKHPNNGFIKRLSGDEELDQHKQEAIAIQFIRQNMAALRDLSRCPGVELAAIGISPVLEFSENTVNVCLSFDPELMRLSVEAGIELVFYARTRLRSCRPQASGGAGKN